jgi:hypothetical protein
VIGMVVGADSILKLLSTYLKQYKLNFNSSFQHLQFMVLVDQNNFGRLFSHSFLITANVHFPQVIIHFAKKQNL